MKYWLKLKLDFLVGYAKLKRLKFILIKKRYITLLFVLFFVIFTLFYFKPLLSCHGLVLNGDSFAHFYFGNTLINGLKKGIVFPQLNIFGGINYFTYYPSFFYYSYALIYFLLIHFFSLASIWNFYLYLIVLAIGLAGFFFVRKLGLPSYLALLFSIIIVLFRQGQCCSGFGSSNIFGVGIVPFAASFIILPVFIWLAILFLESKHNNKKFLLNCFLVSIWGSLLFWSHYYSFLVAEILIFFYFCFELFQKENKQKKDLIIRFISLESLIILLISPILVNYFYFNATNILKTIRSTIPLSSSKKMLRLFFTPGSDNSLDFHFPFFSYLGLLFPFLLIFYKKLYKIVPKFQIVTRLFFSYLATTIFFLYILPISKIKLPYEFVYASLYGRYFAFLKYFYFVFAFVAIYYLIRLTNHRKILSYIILGGITLLVLNYAVVSLGYRNFNCVVPGQDSITRDLEKIAGLIKDKGSGLMVTRGTDVYPSKFLLPLEKEVNLYSVMGAWWPSIKPRNYSYALYDNFQNNNYNEWLKFINDFGINYILAVRGEKINLRGGFHSIYNGKRFSLWQKNQLSKKFEYVKQKAHLILFYDDDIYYKDFKSALHLYESVPSFYKLVIVPSGQVSSSFKLIPFADAVVIGRLDNCQLISKIVSEVEARSGCKIYSYHTNKECSMDFPRFDANLLNKNIQSFPKEIQPVSYFVKNNWYFVIKNSKQQPVLFKNNYLRGWQISQRGRYLDFFLVLPANILFLPNSSDPVLVRYKNIIRFKNSIF